MDRKSFPDRCPAPSHLRDASAAVYAQPDYRGITLLRALVPTEARIDASGGWFDAGDYLKFVQTASFTDVTLLFTLRSFPAGVPTPAALTTEARFGTDWLLRMWDQSRRVLYYQVGIGDGNGRSILGDHDLWRLPQADDARNPRPGSPSYYESYDPTSLLEDRADQLRLALRLARNEPFEFANPATNLDTVAHALGYAVQARMYDELRSTSTFAGFAQSQLDWVLGANAWGSSFVVGAGTVYPHCLASPLSPCWQARKSQQAAELRRGTASEQCQLRHDPRPRPSGAVVAGRNDGGVWDERAVPLHPRGRRDSSMHC
jgi:hypothetical protein